MMLYMARLTPRCSFPLSRHRLPPGWRIAQTQSHGNGSCRGPSPQPANRPEIRKHQWGALDMNLPLLRHCHIFRTLGGGSRQWYAMQDRCRTSSQYLFRRQDERWCHLPDEQLGVRHFEYRTSVELSRLNSSTSAKATGSLEGVEGGRRDEMGSTKVG